jgi:hypothetical protein
VAAMAMGAMGRVAAMGGMGGVVEVRSLFTLKKLLAKCEA